MSKNRIRQRKNRRLGRYLRALGVRADPVWTQYKPPPDGFSTTDECGFKDLTAYNAIRLAENDKWVFIYK